MPDPIVIPCATEEDWHAVRAQAYIGASEAAAVFDLNPYMSKLALWERLQGVEQKREPPNAAMLAGTYLEDGIGKLYAAVYGQRVLTPQEFYGHPKAAKVIVRHPTLPLQCTPDFIIVTQSGARLLQVKNVASWKADQWADQPPRAYRIQVQAEMLCTGMPSAMLAALVGGQELMPHEIERSAAFLQELAEAATSLVALPIAPPPSNNEEIKRLFPESVPGLSKELERPENLYEFARLKAEAERIDEELERVKAALQADIGPAESFTVQGRKAGSWKTSVRTDPPREARSYPVRTLRLDTSVTKQAKSQLPERHAPAILP
jgi:putative phage-type endonuclease